MIARGLFYFIVFFIAAVALRSLFETGWLFFLNFSLICIFLSGLFYFSDQKISKKILLFGLIFLGLALGVWRTDSMLSAKDELSALRDTGEEISLAGIVKGEPDLRANQIKYTVLAKPYNEKILVSLPLHSNFGPGDKISIKGTLKTPEEFPDFNYKEYLLKDGIRTVSFFPEVKLVKKKEFSVLGTVLKIKEKLRETNKEILPFPQSEILAAMILGDSQLLPESIKENFNKVGIRHIVAISGMHIAIIIGILAGIFSKTRFSRRSFLVILAFLIFYIILVGYPASAVRAGIMGSILLLGKRVNREYFALRALILAAFVMLLLNPLLLRFDVGFQLSFLAVLGIILTSGFFEKFLKFLKFNWLKQAAAMTLSAQVFTLPILVYNFGIFSVVSPLANILVVPLVPFLIPAGFIALIGGLINNWFGIFLAFPSFLILKFITWLAEFLASLSWSFKTVSVVGIFWIVIYYFVLFFLVFRNKIKNLTKKVK